MHTQLIDLFESRLKKYHQENKEVIDYYLYWTNKIIELKERLSPTYKLNILNSKTSGKIVNAKVKWLFAENENTNYPYFNVHIGKLENYKKGLNDPQLLKDAKNKVVKFINTKFPPVIIDADNQAIKLKV